MSLRSTWRRGCYIPSLRSVRSGGSQMDVILVFAGWLLVTLLVTSGVAKIYRPGDLPAVGLTGSKARFAARALGITEIAVSVALLAAPGSRTVVKLVLIGLTSGFVSVAALAYRRGIPCGCGGRSNTPATVLTVVRAYVCLGAAISLLFLSQSTSMFQLVPAVSGLLVGVGAVWVLGRDGSERDLPTDLPLDGRGTISRRNVLGGILVAAAGGLLVGGSRPTRALAPSTSMVPLSRHRVRDLARREPGGLAAHAIRNLQSKGYSIVSDETRGQLYVSPHGETREVLIYGLARRASGEAAAFSIDGNLGIYWDVESATPDAASAVLFDDASLVTWVDVVPTERALDETAGGRSALKAWRRSQSTHEKGEVSLTSDSQQSSGPEQCLACIQLCEQCELDCRDAKLYCATGSRPACTRAAATCERAAQTCADAERNADVCCALCIAGCALPTCLACCAACREGFAGSCDSAAQECEDESSLCASMSEECLRRLDECQACRVRCAECMEEHCVINVQPPQP